MTLWWATITSECCAGAGGGQGGHGALPERPVQARYSAKAGTSPAFAYPHFSQVHHCCIGFARSTEVVMPWVGKLSLHCSIECHRMVEIIPTFLQSRASPQGIIIPI